MMLIKCRLLLQKIAFLNTTVLAPLIEEATYRTPQILVRICMVFRDSYTAPLISSYVTTTLALDTMFGLAHTGQADLRERLNSPEFLHSFIVV